MRKSAHNDEQVAEKWKHHSSLLSYMYGRVVRMISLSNFSPFLFFREILIYSSFLLLHTSNHLWRRMKISKVSEFDEGRASVIRLRSMLIGDVWKALRKGSSPDAISCRENSWFFNFIVWCTKASAPFTFSFHTVGVCSSHTKNEKEVFMHNVIKSMSRWLMTAIDRW